MRTGLAPRHRGRVDARMLLASAVVASMAVACAQPTTPDSVSPSQPEGTPVAGTVTSSPPTGRAVPTPGETTVHDVTPRLPRGAVAACRRAVETTKRFEDLARSVSGPGDGLFLLFDLSDEFDGLPLSPSASHGPGAGAVYRRTEQLATTLLDAATASLGAQGGVVSREYATATWHQVVDRLTALERFCDGVGVSLIPTESVGRRAFVVLSQRWRHDYRRDVLEVQQRLNVLGYDWVDPDGHYGPLTEAAVETFQRMQGLRIDGVVGPQTWHALFAPGRAGTVRTGDPGSDGAIGGDDSRGGGVSPVSVPAPAPSAICADGTSSYSAHHPGTCSWHGGVTSWLN